MCAVYECDGRTSSKWIIWLNFIKQTIKLRAYLCAVWNYRCEKDSTSVFLRKGG